MHLLPQQLNKHFQIYSVHLELTRVRQCLLHLLLLRWWYVRYSCYRCCTISDFPDVSHAYGDLLPGAEEVEERGAVFVVGHEGLIGAMTLRGFVGGAAPAFVAVFREGVGLEEGRHVFLVETDEGF